MNENDLFNFQLEYTFTADWLAELDRQLALLLSTREGTMPLDRAFGLNMDFVDMPPEAAKSLYTAEVTEKVSKFIPEVRVQEVTWTGGNTGKLFPKVVITSSPVSPLALVSPVWGSMIRTPRTCLSSTTRPLTTCAGIWWQTLRRSCSKRRAARCPWAAPLSTA